MSRKRKLTETDLDTEDESSDESSEESEFNSYSESSDSDEDDETNSSTTDIENNDTIKWVDVEPNFVPRHTIPIQNEPIVNFAGNSTPLEIFKKLLPKSFFTWTAQCTNERLDILAEEKGKPVTHTDAHEIMLVFGCTLVMSYNRLPQIHLYWSKNKTLGNDAIKSAMTRDRFMLLHSKLYFNNPEKPKGASKTYYMDEFINCLKFTFNQARAEATHQSIDECMVLFKGRSSMKQYMPKKPKKRGIKIWGRSDSRTGYAYDFNIYRGAEVELLEGTLGERVVTTLCRTIREPGVCICTDRFFTSVKMMRTSPFACTGTVNTNRINLPTMSEKLKRGESSAKCIEQGVIAFKWQDTKEVLLLSNCHDGTISSVDRKLKDGTKKTFACPEAIAFYNRNMGGVDLTDQITGVYDINRKSNKWWKRVYQRLLMTAVTNSWIIYKQLCGKPKLPLLDFLMSLSEDLIELGKSGARVRRRNGTGRPSKRSKLIINAQHMPAPTTRRRCTYCSERGKESRTTVMCSTCSVPLCVFCFDPYHNK